jgi:hypothetical protein
MGLENVFARCPVLVDNNWGLYLNRGFLFSKDCYLRKYFKSERKWVMIIEAKIFSHLRHYIPNSYRHLDENKWDILEGATVA